jgi:hypothetical protein
MTLAMVILSSLVLFGCTEQKNNEKKNLKMKEIDLSQYSDTSPERKLNILFIHHSVGAQWLASKGSRKDIVPDSLHETHPNGGGLRDLLQKNNYFVGQAGYKSEIGEKTDICHWNAKFRDKMDVILQCKQQDTLYEDGKTNDIIIFKSCFPNNAIESEGTDPGSPNLCEKTTANYKAAYDALLEYFKEHPNVLFVVITAPPLVKNVPSRAKEFFGNLLGWGNSVAAVGERARRFNNWLKDVENGWLSGYQGKNVVVFDYYDVLTGKGQSNYSIYPTRDGGDSHPSAEGNAIAAREFISFINKAVERHDNLR